MLEQKCPAKDDLELFLNRKISAIQKEEIELHLASCEGCRQNLSAVYQQSISEEGQFKAPDHLVEKVKHLPAKESLRKEETETTNSPVSWYRQNFFQLAFAAGLLICVGLFGGYFLLDQQTAVVPDDVFRNGTSDKKVIELLSPPENAVLKSDRVNFRWVAIDGVKTYELVLSDETGDIIREVKTDKLNIGTSGTELGLITGKKYFWQIRARLKDGLSSESETRRFSIKGSKK